MKFEYLNSESEIRDLIWWHNIHSKYVVIDVETNSIDARDAILDSIQISGYEEDHAVLFDTNYRKLLIELSSKICLVAHNAKYDLHVLFRHGVDLLDRPFRDTILLGHLLDENRESYSLDSYVKEYWNDNYKEEFWKKYKTYQEASKEEQLEYACKDIVRTVQLYEILTKELSTQGIPAGLIEHIHRLQRCLLQTEIQGIGVDIEYLHNLGLTLKEKINTLRTEMRLCVDTECKLWEMEEYEKELGKRKTEKGKSQVKIPTFSFDSSKQLQGLLYRYLGLPEQRNEKTKSTSTDEAALQRIKDAHKVIPLVLDYKGYHKTYTAFIDGTEKRLINGNIYPEFRVNGTVTGRISHSNPNLGQLPKSGGVRGIYIPARGNVFISADYSQLEVCIEANFTKDSNLIKVFRDGASKHDITAGELGVSRDIAKTLNFALQYGATHFKVSKILGVSENEAKKVWQKYWEIYSGPRELKQKIDLRVDRGEPIITPFGRRRRFQKRKRSIWDSDYRQAYNFLIQGTGADITSKAFYLVSEWLERSNVGRGLFTVHDEVLIEVNEKDAKAAEQFLLDTMVSVGNEIGLEIPLKAESSGPMSRWLD